jgi:putative FmdB family regulatory protein
MPIYEFICRQCEKSFEALVKADQRDSTACLRCGSTKTARKISLTAPAQIRSAASNLGMPETCGQPSCCGGGCRLPN